LMVKIKHSTCKKRLRGQTARLLIFILIREP
jgi:hypothetical protein